MLLLESIRSIMRGCIANSIFRKPTRPSLPLRKAPHLSPSLSSLRKRGCNRPTVLNFLPLRLSCKESSTFSPSPSSSGSGDVTALRCSEPLRSKVGGASKPFAILCGMGPPYYNLLLVFAILCGMGPPYYNLLLVFAILCGLGPPGVGSL